MLQVYMAGPISGLNYDGATSWRDYAKQRLEAGGQIRALSPLRHQENLKTIERFSDAGDETERLNDVMSSPLRIPIHSGRVFRFEAGHRSDLMSATIPI